MLKYITDLWERITGNRARATERDRLTKLAEFRIQYAEWKAAGGVTEPSPEFLAGIREMFREEFRLSYKKARP